VGRLIYSFLIIIDDHPQNCQGSETVLNFEDLKVIIDQLTIKTIKSLCSYLKRDNKLKKKK